jgi:hypothetical protein
VPGPLSSSRPRNGDQNLTGGEATNTWGEFEQNSRQIRRSVHQARETRTGNFSVDGRPPTAKKQNQKALSSGVSNLRTQPMFVARRKRK